MAGKLSSKKLKQPDEFISVSSRLLTWATKHYKVGLAVLLFLCLAVAGWGVYQQKRSQNLEAAAEQLNRLQLDPFRLEPASVPALERIAREYPNSGSALVAEIYLAHLLFQEQKYDAAATRYQALKGRDPGLDVMLAENLSYCYEAQKQYLAAAEALAPLVQDPQLPLRSDFLRRQAMLYELAGEKPKALSIYRQLLTQHPNSPLTSFIQEKIARLGTQ